MSTYHSLLRIAVEHSYYSSGVCSCLDFRPTDATQRLFNNTGLIFRKTTDGIQIIYDDSRLQALQLYAEDANEPLCIVFRAYSSDPDFKSYSEPFAADNNEILYFDNHTPEGIKRNGCLSVLEYVSGEDFKDLNLFEHIGALKSGSKNTDVDKEKFRDILDQKDHLSPPDFVVRIFVGNNRESLLKQWLEPKPTFYSIRFSSRQRHWKYYLLGRIVTDNTANHGFCIVDPDSRVEFEVQDEELLADQSVAYTFRSKHRIPLSEHYPFRLQLKQKGQGDETVVIPCLPVASVNQVGTDVLGEKTTVVSEIYVNS